MKSSQPATATLVICRICGQSQRDDKGNKLPNPDALQLAQEVETLLKDSPVRVMLTDCLSVCTKPISWGLRAGGKHAFVFSPATTAADMATTARTYATLPPGQKLGKAMMPKPVSQTLISRLPPVD